MVMTLKAYLEKRGMTQKQFADAIGTSQAAVARYVTGARTPNRQAMREIARVTKGAVSANDFVLVQEAA